MKIRKFGLCMGLIAGFAAAGLPTTGSLASRNQDTGPAADPLSLYGPEILFDVYRKDEKVGFHRVRFSGRDETIDVQSEFNLQIEILYVPVFRYVYRSESRWRQGRLHNLAVTLNDDGERSALDAIRVGDRLRVDHTGGAYTAELPLFPTNHWNAGVLGQDRVLNTLTGRINSVRITPVARETVATERGDVPATRYAYTGELETEVWYDDAGRWVKMRFAGRDGSMIEYVCRRCQGPKNGTAAK
jgi:hypothetical protein